MWMHVYHAGTYWTHHWDTYGTKGWAAEGGEGPLLWHPLPRVTPEFHEHACCSRSGVYVSMKLFWRKYVHTIRSMYDNTRLSLKHGYKFHNLVTLQLCIDLCIYVDTELSWFCWEGSAIGDYCDSKAYRVHCSRKMKRLRIQVITRTLAVHNMCSFGNKTQS